MNPEYQKLAFVGAVGSGKSTIVRTLSEIKAVDTDVKSTVDIGKKNTTVGIDYGRLVLGQTMALGLYGVPGQERFSVLWQHVAKSLWGIAFLLKNDDLPDVSGLKPALEYFDPVASNTPFVVGLTHVDKVDESIAEKLDMVKVELQALGLNVPVLPISCIDQRSSMAIPYYLNSLSEIQRRSQKAS